MMTEVIKSNIALHVQYACLKYYSENEHSAHCYWIVYLFLLFFG